MMADDSALLRLYIATRSEAAFAELVTRYISLVYHAALRQLGAETQLAEDVTQVVFSRLAQKSASLAHHSSLAGWLHTTTRFAAREALRSERRRRIREQDAYRMKELFSESDVDWTQLRPVIDDALDELGESDREALLLRFFANQPLAAVGLALQVSENTARMRVERALDKLQPLLAKRGITSTGAALGLTLTHQALATVPTSLAAAITGTALVAGSAVTATGILGFMSTTKFASALAAAALLSVSVAVYETRSSRASEAALARERRENLVLATRADDAARRAKTEQQNLALSRAAAGTHPALLSPSSTIPEYEGNGPMGPNPPGSRARGRALAAAYPEFHQLWVRVARQSIAGRFTELYRELNLSTAEIETFEMIMVSGVSWGIDYPVPKSREHYLPGKTPLLSITMDAAPVLPKTEKDDRLRALLGESGFSRLKEFENQPRDSRIQQLASALYFTDTPLTPELGAKFERVLSDRSRSHRGTTSAEYWAAVREDSRAFLSEPQLEALKGLQAQDEFNLAAPGNRSSQRLAADTAPSQ